MSNDTKSKKVKLQSLLLIFEAFIIEDTIKADILNPISAFKIQL